MNAIAQRVPSDPVIATCFRCCYESPASEQRRCPTCGFPLIGKVGHVPYTAPKVAGMFERSSLRVGAPPLPGVDAEPRKAQLMQQARQQRWADQRACEAAERARSEGLSAHRRATVWVFGSAVAFGLLAVVVTNLF